MTTPTAPAQPPPPPPSPAPQAPAAPKPVATVALLKRDRESVALEVYAACCASRQLDSLKESGMRQVARAAFAAADAFIAVREEPPGSYTDQAAGKIGFPNLHRMPEEERRRFLAQEHH